MSDIHAELRARVDTFTDELAALVRRAALEAVREALNAPRDGAAPSRKRRAGSGAATHRAASPAAPRAARGAKASAAKTGQKRDPKLLAKLVERLAAQIAAKPGQRIEQINKPLGVPTKDLSLPIKKLLRANRILAKGQKRSTTYWPK
jgi:hypothetical protein